MGFIGKLPGDLSLTNLTLEDGVTVASLHFAGFMEQRAESEATLE